jgi:hypothetical protein
MTRVQITKDSAYRLHVAQRAFLDRNVRIPRSQAISTLFRTLRAFAASEALTFAAAEGARHPWPLGASGPDRSQAAQGWRP